MALCDELGIYVMAEADIESHGFVAIERPNVRDQDKLSRLEINFRAFDLAGKWTSDNPDGREAYLDRAVQLVERFKNHTSVIFWSLGNEASYGQNHIDMCHRIKRADPIRLIHYEGDRHGVTTDMYSIMYLTPDELRKSVAERTDRPLIHCEFAHSMGNGPGGLVDYVEAYGSEKLLQREFVWQWCNHGLLKKRRQPILLCIWRRLWRLSQ